MFNLEATERKPPLKSIPADLVEKMDAIEAGKWTMEDVLEMQVDEDDVGETTTAGAVGSGVPAKLGMSRPNHAYEKLKKSYEEYISKTGKLDNKKTIREFVERSSPGNDKLVDGLTNYLKEGDAAHDAIKKWAPGAVARQDREAKQYADRKKKAPPKQPEWTTFEGIKVLMIKGENFVAVPVNGRENSANWEVISIKPRKLVTKLKKAEVRQWLIKKLA